MDHDFCEMCQGHYSQVKMNEMRNSMEGLIQGEMARLVNTGTLWARIQGMEDMSLNDLSLLKPHPDVCQVCAADHGEQEPHNPESLYWQVARRSEGLPPATWEDAMAHCSMEVQNVWKEALAEYGFVCPECDGWKKDASDYICANCRATLDAA